MKNFTIIIMMLFASFSFAQNQPIDFEPGGYGADWTWTVFENSTNPPLEIVSNPNPSGINTSATVAKFTALEDGEPHAGVESERGVDLGTFQWDENNRIVRIMVWKPVISNVGIKFATETGWAEQEILVSNTVTNQWEELTFDFSNAINPPDGNGTLGQIIIFPDFADRDQDNVIYFDNITFGPGGDDPPPPGDAPEVAAPTPTHNAENVISLFSAAYDDVPVDTWRTDWSAANYEEVTIDGRPTKKYTNLDFVGIETVANQIDITEMTHFHLHVWSPNFTLFRVKLVDFGPDGEFGGGDDTEHELIFESPAQGQWVSLDIPLDQFADLQNRENIAQLILSGQPVGETTVFVDNVLFYKDTGTNGDDAPTVAAPMPTQEPADVISLFSEAYDDVPVDTWRTEWSVADYEEVTIDGRPTKKYTNLDFVGIETVANQIDITGMTHFHMHVWSPNFTLFRVKLVDFQPDDHTEHEVEFPGLTQGEWVSLDIPLDQFTDLQNRENIAQLILSGQPIGETTVYVDNVFFYTTLTSTNDLAADQNQVVFYPNPVRTGELVTLSAQAKQVDVYDVAGKLIQSFVNTSSVETDQMNRGVYFMRIQSDDGSIQTNKLIVK